MLVLRTVAAGVIVVVCALSGTTSLPFIVERLGAPLPVGVSWKPAVASVGIEKDGRIVVLMSPAVVHYQGADALAFLYLHEVGHARLGHLLPSDPRTELLFASEMRRSKMWQMEYDADEWSAKALVAKGYDPARGISLILALYGDGGGLTHPSDRARVERVKRIMESGSQRSTIPAVLPIDE